MLYMNDVVVMGCYVVGKKEMFISIYRKCLRRRSSYLIVNAL